MPAAFSSATTASRRMPGGEVDVGDGSRRAACRAPRRRRSAPSPAPSACDQFGRARRASRQAASGSVTRHRSRRDRLTIIAAVAPQMRRSCQGISLEAPLAPRHMRARLERGWRVEQEGERHLEHARHLRLAGRSGRSGGTTPITGVTSIAGAGAVAVDRADHVDRRRRQRDLLLRLAQRGGDRVLAGIDPAAGKGDLARRGGAACRCAGSGSRRARRGR